MDSTVRLPSAACATRSAGFTPSQNNKVGAFNAVNLQTAKRLTFHQTALQSEKQSCFPSPPVLSATCTRKKKDRWSHPPQQCYRTAPNAAALKFEQRICTAVCPTQQHTLKTASKHVLNSSITNILTSKNVAVLRHCTMTVALNLSPAQSCAAPTCTLQQFTQGIQAEYSEPLLKQLIHKHH